MVHLCAINFLISFEKLIVLNSEIKLRINVLFSLFGYEYALK